MIRWAMALFVVSTLTGCIFSGNQTSIVTDENGKVIAGRNQYDAFVEGKEADSEALKKLAEMINTPTVSTTVSFDKENKPVYNCSVNVAGSITASHLRDIQNSMSSTSVPETPVAQGIKATGVAIRDTVSLPVFLAGGVAYVAGKTATDIAKNNGDKIQNGDIIGSQNNTKVVGDGTASAPSITGDTVIEDKVE